MTARYTGGVAKAALLSLIQSNVTTAQVVYGPPWPLPEDDVVAIGDVSTIRDRPRMGARTVDETHDITVTVSCADGMSNDQQAVTERAAALLDAVDGALRAVAGEDMTAGNGIYLATIGERIELVETPDAETASQGRSAALAFTVRVQSRRT